MRRAVWFVVEFFGISWNNRVFEVSDDAQTDEVVVPNHVIRDHEEAEELLWQQKLALFIADVGESRRIGIGVTFQELVSI